MTGGGGTLNIFGLGGVRVPNLFGYDLLWNDLPYSKGFMEFGVHGIWYSVWLNFLLFCLDHLNMIWDFVRIISNKKCLFYILCCSGHFLARFFGFWELGDLCR